MLKELFRKKKCLEVGGLGEQRRDAREFFSKINEIKNKNL